MVGKEKKYFKNRLKSKKSDLNQINPIFFLNKKKIANPEHKLESTEIWK